MSDHIREHLATLFQNMEAASETGDDVTGLATGFRDIDRFTGGLRAHELTAVAGLAQSSYRDLMMSMAQYQAAELGEPVVWVGLVETATQLAIGWVAAEAMVDVRRIEVGRLEEKDWRNLGDALTKLAEAPLHVRATTKAILDDIAHLCDEHRPRVVFIDSFSALLENERDQGEARWDAAAQLLWKLRRTAEAFDTHVVVGTVVNPKAVNARTDKRPMLDDLTETSMWSTYANTALLLYRDEVHNPDTPDRGIAEFLIHRFAPERVGLVKGAYLGHVRKFANLARPAPVPSQSSEPPAP